MRLFLPIAEDPRAAVDYLVAKADASGLAVITVKKIPWIIGRVDEIKAELRRRNVLFRTYTHVTEGLAFAVEKSRGTE